MITASSPTQSSDSVYSGSTYSKCAEKQTTFMFTEDATKRSGETQKKQTNMFSSFFKIDFCFLRKKKRKTFQKPSDEVTGGHFVVKPQLAKLTERGALP